MDPYKVLNIDRDATPDQIRKAYRSAAKKHHPDMGGEAWIFQQVQEAYESLTNPKVRKKSKRKTNANPSPKSNQGKKTKRKSKPNSSAKSSRGQEKAELDFSGIDIDLGNSHAPNKKSQARDSMPPKERFRQKTDKHPPKTKEGVQKKKKRKALRVVSIAVILISLVGIGHLYIRWRANSDSSAISKPQEERNSDLASVRGKILLPSLVSAKDLKFRFYHRRENAIRRGLFQPNEDGEFKQKLRLRLNSETYTIQISQDKDFKTLLYESEKFVLVKGKILDLGSIAFRGELQAEELSGRSINKPTVSSEDTEAKLLTSASKPKREPRIAKNIEWIENLEEAQALSKREGLPLLLYIYSDYSDPKNPKPSVYYPYLSSSRVFEQSRQFICVKVRSSSLLKQKFNVRSSPHILILGNRDENIHRFPGLRLSTSEFLKNLKIGLDRYALYKAEKDWFPKQEPIADWKEELLLDAISAPLKGKITGIATAGNEIFIAQAESRTFLPSSSTYLFKLDARTGKVLMKTRLQNSIYGICADDKFIYAAHLGWTARKPIYVYDRFSFELVRKLVTKANKTSSSHSCHGIACHEGKLYLLNYSGIVATVNSTSGKIEKSVKLESKGDGLDFDGENFLSGTKDGIAIYRPDGSLQKTIRSPHEIYRVAFSVDSVLASYAQEWGHDKNHQAMRLRPEKVEIFKIEK